MWHPVGIFSGISTLTERLRLPQILGHDSYQNHASAERYIPTGGRQLASSFTAAV
jgi:hypothetical protein